MEASRAPIETMDAEFEDWFQREIDGGLPEGDDRPSVRLRCDYLLERIADQEKRQREIEEFTARKIFMIQDHSASELATIQKRIEWLQSKLRLHLPGTGDGMEREFGKKSLSLPHGTIGFRASAATLRITDMAKAVAWAKTAGVAVKTETVEKVYVADLKVAMGLTGEIPDGAEFVDASESFYVKPKVEG